jgi:FdhE protein
MTITPESWLTRHPFLEPIARLEETVDKLVGALPQPRLADPPFEKYKRDFESGVALLQSPSVGPELLAGAVESFELLALSLIKAPIPEALASKAREVYDYLHQAPEMAKQALAAIVADNEQASKLPHLGTARYIAWTAIAHALSPTISAFDTWREHALWPQGYCPTCGNKPLLSLLAQQGEGRRRSLVCSLCKTRWNVRRLGCPHCGTEDGEKLGIFELEYEPNLRLEVCDTCRGYLKTWAGEVEAAPFFSDWATLHLDAMAAERGYQRVGASLYEI